jgi:glycosyltransferase involved in cell wall biosynthesis
MPEPRLSIVIPAHNEEALIAETLEAVLASVARASAVARRDLRLPRTACEIIVVDDQSEDRTAAIVDRFVEEVGVRSIPCIGGTCGAARNAGVAISTGRVLCFVDADTLVPANAVERILQLHEDEGMCLVLYRLAAREPGLRPWLWWTFWGLARHLPLARAKSMPGFMSCDRAHFMRYGPFDAACMTAEEWPLTGPAYRHHRQRFRYEWRLTGRTSSRRMALRPFGYLRTFLAWVSVVLFRAARVARTENVRHQAGHR